MTSYNLFLANFHFVRPLWLLAITVLFLVLWLLKKHRFHQSPWQKFLPTHLSGVLVEGATNSSVATKQPLQERLFLIKPFIIGLLSIIALAGPAWQKLPQPVYQTERGSVLIMDMSYSMYATDIKPNRLTRARFKAIDLLNKISDGDVGLIAYAGDAFVISPLTQDIKNIELLLPSLTPEIMPELGANPLAALTLAHEMLINAGHLTGDIYWFTDDVDSNEISDIYDWSAKYGHRLNILGIGSTNGAPIKLPSGELLKDDNGAIVVPRLPTQKLQSLASRGHGNYQMISNGDSDIENLIMTFDAINNNKGQQQESQQTGDQWQEQGAWLLLLVLPLALSYFRRGGAILIVPLTGFPLLFSLSLSLVSPTSYADEVEEKESTPAPSFLQKTWQDLWQTKDQQAQQQYNQENYQSAAQQFKNSQWQGSAHYKAGNYQEALDAFTQGEQANSANSLYNQGNALAQMKKYEEAIDAYEQALKENPDLQDAKDNIEKLKQQQKKEQEQDQNDQSEDKKSKDDKSESDKSEDQGDQQQKQDKDSQQQSQDKSDEQQSSEDSANESQPKDEQQEQQKQSESESDKKENENESDQKQEQQAEQDKESTEQNEEKTAAQIAAEQQAKETTQKHQQLLNKVTDDPYLLLRNKMQLEYQKRRQDGASQGVNKKW